MKNLFKSKGKGSKTDSSEEASRNALFGNAARNQRRQSTESTASRDTQLPAYSDPYADTKPAGQGPEPYLQHSQSYKQTSSQYSNADYASDPYASQGSSQTHNRGALALSSRNSNSITVQREELFRGVQPDKRLEPTQTYGTTSDADSHVDGQYDLQTQEEEDEDIEGIKQEIRFVKQESLSSTRNALRMANEAEEAGRSTLTKLGEQSDSLANAEQSMDLSSLANRDAKIKARDLKHLNRSMFAVQVNKPWGKNKRLELEELRVRQQYDDEQADRDEREERRKESERRTDANLKAHAQLMAQPAHRHRMGLAERSKYQFDADSDDDEVEGEIDDNLDQLAAVTGRLKGLAMATNTEVMKQNAQLSRMDEKGSNLGRDIYMNTHRLKKISERG